MKKLICIMTFLVLGQIAHAGPRVIGNGGDAYALQFVSFAEKILLYLQSARVEGIDVEALGQAIETTKVESTDSVLLLNNIPKDAINYPTEKRIVFNRQRWSALMANEKMALVLHEYLGILNIEDASYKFSKMVLADFEVIQKIRPGSDSTWFVCQDDTLAVSSFEHRRGGDGRATEITLLKGAWTLSGGLVDVNAGPLTLENKAMKANFVGDINIDHRKQTLFLKGVLDLNSTLIEINTTMPCEEKSRY